MAFADCGADLAFPEAPRSEDEMRRLCREIPAPTMANMVEQRGTPLLSAPRLDAVGYKLAVYPLTLLSAAIRAG